MRVLLAATVAAEDAECATLSGALCSDTGEGGMGATACGLVADLIDWIEGPHSDHGRPRCSTEAVVETLQFFLREGVQWREMRAPGGRVCRARLRRRPTELRTPALLRPGHAPPVPPGRPGPGSPAAA